LHSFIWKSSKQIANKGSNLNSVSTTADSTGNAAQLLPLLDVSASTSLVCDVTVSEGCKLIHVHSPIALFNHTPVKLEIKLLLQGQAAIDGHSTTLQPDDMQLNLNSRELSEGERMWLPLLASTTGGHEDFERKEKAAMVYLSVKPIVKVQERGSKFPVSTFYSSSRGIKISHPAPRLRHKGSKSLGWTFHRCIAVPSPSSPFKPADFCFWLQPRRHPQGGSARSARGDEGTTATVFRINPVAVVENLLACRVGVRWLEVNAGESKKRDLLFGDNKSQQDVFMNKRQALHSMVGPGEEWAVQGARAAFDDGTLDDVENEESSGSRNKNRSHESHSVLLSICFDALPGAGWSTPTRVKVGQDLLKALERKRTAEQEKDAIEIADDVIDIYDNRRSNNSSLRVHMKTRLVDGTLRVVQNKHPVFP